MRRGLSTGANERAQGLTARWRRGRRDVALRDGQDQPGTIFASERFERRARRSTSVDDHRAHRSARGRFNGPLPTALDLDEIEERTEDTLQVADDRATTGPGKFVQSPRQRLGVGLGPGGPVRRLAKFFVARRTFDLGFVGRVLRVLSLLTSTLQRESCLLERVSNHLVF